MGAWRIELGYDGTNFHGFARQAGVRTVQGVMEECLARVLKQEVALTAAGRTDAGVHARSQVVSFVADQEIDTERLSRSLNGMLGPEVVVTSLSRAPDGFNARFSATSRTYRYQVLNTPLPDPMLRHFSWHVPEPLDLTAMNAAATLMCGQHDFAAFCRVTQGGTTVRTVLEAFWLPDDPFLAFVIKARAFCHQMVRSIVGFGVDVGRRRRGADEVPAVLESGDRSAAAPIAPPQGLILWEVGYPPNPQSTVDSPESHVDGLQS
jgi:tRNA pseudouridine38-40 synthase